MERLYLSFVSPSVRDFHPSYFAMVMATGIVSIAFDALAFPGIAKTLFILNLVLYLMFCLMLGARTVFFPRNLVAELRTLPRSWLFLAFVIGTNTVGMQFTTFLQAGGLASALWFVALLAWLIFLTVIALNAAALPRESVMQSVNGATLLVIVSTVSLALLGARLLDPERGHAPLFLGLWALWTLGFILYLFVVYWIIRRLFFDCFRMEDWQPPYWICMGAPAIITLAGSEFVIRLPRSQWNGLDQLTLGMSFFAWILGTLWIPYLLVMDVRKLTRIPAPVPLWIKIFPWARYAFGTTHHAYEPPAWSRVFPMGMYTACTFFLAKATGYRLLESVSSCWGWFTLLIWALTLVGAFRSFGKFMANR
ncbi:MAG TPA: tellurite resistance/C4-dicarboxylate transporter family protein [Nitrosospira sp.]|nr:tellurite resistance/C4-dicarboxylate transporter family protein [Nitrosospira sp.]